jgi:5,10-methylenetetrahydrofolate reductase
MKPKLNMLDHIIFPTDNDQLQFIADIADKNNSGAEVPIANTVNPISNEETLKNFANLTLVFIK